MSIANKLIKPKQYSIIWLSLILVISACSEKKTASLMIEALPINAQVEGDMLAGPSILSDPNRFVWGASVIQGEDGKYHMLYNTWSCGDSIPAFSESWVQYSRIAYAVSDYPDRDFKFQEIVLRGRALDGDSSAWDAQMVTNPHIRKFNGKYYLYYVGSRDPGIQPEGSKGEHVNKRNRVQQYQKIGVIEFNTFADLKSGNFTRPESPILSPRTRVKPDNIVEPSPEGTIAKPDNIVVVNPSVVQRPSDGAFLLFFKGNLYDPHWRGAHGVAISDSPMGPFTAYDQFVFDIKLDDGRIASAEDPYVWYHHQHQKFYAVMKDFSGKITEGKPGLALLESVNGIEWTKAAHPFFMKKELVLNSGDTINVKRLERPQLLTNETGNPQVLYCACAMVDINPRQDGASFNVQIPLRINK